MTAALLPARTTANAVALDWLAQHHSGPEAAFLARLLSRKPACMPEWAAYYGTSECWRWFPSDAQEGGQPMDIPRFLVQYMPGGVRRDVSGCIDYPTRREAMLALAAGFVAWLSERLHATTTSAGYDLKVKEADRGQQV